MVDIAQRVDYPSRKWSVSARFILNEAAGSLGDLGTFVPIVAAMTLTVGLDAGTILVFAGLANIVTGLVFRIPIAVQPMKVIAALAIMGTMNAAQVGMAGVAMGVVMLLMGGSRLVNWVARVIPRDAIRGLQAAVAFQLLLAGLRFGLHDQSGAALRPLWGTEGLVVAASILAVALLLRHRPQWVAFGLTALGLVYVCLRTPSLLQGVRLTVWQPRWVLSDLAGLSGVWIGSLPQVPLTLLNSVLAVSVLAGNLFPDEGRQATPARISVSVGLMNLLSCPFGGMPLCHGSGGLAAQHHLGARSGLSMVLLGSGKLFVGLLFGGAALVWLRSFPSSILAVFLFMAGMGLASASQCWATRRGLVTACVMVAVHLATGLLVLGFAAGWMTCAFWPEREHESRPAVAATGRTGRGDAGPRGRWRMREVTIGDA